MDQCDNANMKEWLNTLFSTKHAFEESDYLRCLSLRVPQNLADQLARDAHPDLGLDRYIETSDVLRPLTTFHFPAESETKTRPIFQLIGVLHYILYGYAITLLEGSRSHDPYKQIYISSYYLHCGLHRGSSSFDYVFVWWILATAAEQIDLEGRLQVIRFINSLVPLLPGPTWNDPTPISSTLLALSSIAFGVFSELSVSVERAMHEEDFGVRWKSHEEECKRDAETSEGEKTLSIETTQLLRQAMLSLFVPASKFEQIPARFDGLKS